MSNEKSLIKQCQKGQRVAQRKLYELYRSKWYVIAMRYMRNNDDALDVLQNALVKIYSKMEMFNAELGSFSSWSSKIVVNESIMYQRKYWKHQIVDSYEEELLKVEDDFDPVSMLSAKELIKLIQTLPNGYRVVLNLFVIEGYSHKEISEILEISVSTSKSQLFKAKKLMKKKIEGLFFNVEKYA